MTMGFQLGKDQLPVDRNLKATAIRGNERDRLDHVLIILQQLICQAHGPTGVVSDRAINDFDFQHKPSENFGRLYH